ncbi:MAG: 50S ribosomal protein L11 [Candidatus Hadarchaeales archaeon]
MSPEIKLLIEGGKATPGPPIGPALGPFGLNVAKIVAEINQKTQEFEGMKVPVTLIIDPKTKSYEIKVGLPPVSALIKKELGLEKGASAPQKEIVGNLTMEQAIKIAKMKRGSSLAKTLKAAVKEVLGTCVSMGVTVEGKDPRIVQKEIDEGKYDEVLKE